MARVSSRWIIVLCLCLLSQEFAPVYTSYLSNNGLVKAKRSDEQEDEPVQEEESQSYQDDKQTDNLDVEAKQRGWVSLAKWTWKGIKKGLSVAEKLSDVASIGDTIRRAIQGCSADFPQIKTYWARSEELAREYNRITEDIDKEILKAYNMRDSANFSYMIHYDVRQEMERLVKEQKYAFEAMDPQFKIALNNETYNLEQMIKKKKANGEDVELLEIEKGYKEGLQLALDLAFPSLSLLMPYVPKLFRHLKGGVIGDKIEQLQNKFGKFSIRKSTPPDKVKLLKGYRSLGVKADSKGLTSKISRMVGRMKQKYAKVKNVVDGIKTGFKTALKVGSIVLSIWGIIKDAQDCAEKNLNAVRSVEKMEEFVRQNREILVNATEIKVRTKEAMQEVFNVAWDDEFLDALELIENMVKEDDLFKSKSRANEIINSIENYKAGSIDLPGELFSLQNNLRMKLPMITYDVGCFTIKGKFRTDVFKQCSKGQNTFDEAYDLVVNSYPYPSKIEDCNTRTGKLYISVDELKRAWRAFLKGESDANEVCLMNDESTVARVKEQLMNGVTDAEKIAQSMGLKNKKGAIKEIKEVIKSLPSIDELPLPQNVIETICMLKNVNLTPEKVAKMNLPGTDRDVTEDQVKKVFEKCP